MHTDSGNTRMHDCRDFSYMKSKKRHLHQHICIRILIVKVIIFGIKQKCFPVQTLKSCGWICKIFTCPSAKQEAKPHEGNFFCRRNREFCASFHKSRSQNNVRNCSVFIRCCQCFINSRNITYIMLSVCIHLDHILILFADCIFISKLQTTSITQIKHMRYHCMISPLCDPVR